MLLYSRQDCPLCEDVEETLQKLGIEYKFIDIDQDDGLRKKYNAKIPVLMNKQSNELYFPFTDKELREFSNS